jgi:D-alanyl-lipoteichoic acid acyltransferase DltB (MBOAT superfamily)
MRPFRSFLLLLILLICLTGLSFLFPGNTMLPPVNYFFPSLISVSDQIPAKAVAEKSIPSDLPPGRETDIQHDTSALPALLPVSHPLTPFIDSLKDSDGQVRIMYYGDSQVEGDRITFYLRQLLRQGRGGTGPGLFLPVMPVMYTKSLYIRASSNWKRYNYLSFKEGEINANALGPFMTTCRFLPEGMSAASEQKANIRLRPSAFADSAVAYFDQLRVLYSNPAGVVNIKVNSGNKILFSGSLENSNRVEEFRCYLEGGRDIFIEFTGKVSPDVFGISIESEKGVVIDNIPKRGSAGLEFTLVDRNNLKECFRLLSPDLIVLHYGLNIVRNVRDDYAYYKQGLIRQIELLKEVTDGTPVLLVSVTDMAENKGDSLRSYSNIPYIIRAQREAASESGAAFWDAYVAMGGAGSVLKWAGKSPRLAQDDYVHFTYTGADTISKMLAGYLLSGYSGKTVSSINPSSSDSLPPVSEFNANEKVRQESPGKHSGTVMSQIFSYDPDRPFIFSSPAFWIFLLIALAGYSILYRKLFLRNFYLFLISIFFYFKTGGLFLLLLIVVSVIDFTCGILIHRAERKTTKRLFLILSIISNLGILAYFKYSAFLISSINDLFGTSFRVYDLLASISNDFLGTSFDISTIILPVGISFFTFQSLSYTIDVYRAKLIPVRNFIDFGFYVSFFPQLVAGPIVRASEFIPQLYNEFHLTKREFSHATFLIIKGLIKKIVISDFLATNLIDRVFELPALYSGFENLMAIYGYGLQIYCDFSGYTDIAIGIALIFGFRLPVNFNSPYKASGVADFWKRWHISLSRWLRDYLYIPLGGNRKGSLRTGINLMITMLLGGLWHGAATRFIIWGGLHGTGLVINKIWDNLLGHRIKPGRFYRAINVFLTFNFISFCWIFFRAPDMGSVSLMFKQIFSNFSPGSYSAMIPVYSSVFLAMITGYTIHFLPEKVKESYRGLYISMPLVVQFIIIFAAALLLYQMSNTEVMPFIYFRF